MCSLTYGQDLFGPMLVLTTPSAGISAPFSPTNNTDGILATMWVDGRSVTTNANGRVTAWNDLTTSGFNFATNGDNYASPYVTNLAGGVYNVTFDGATNMLYAATATNYQPCQAWFVVKVPVINVSVVNLLSANGRDQYTHWDESIRMSAGTSLKGAAGSYKVVNAWTVITLGFDGANSYILTNGVPYIAGNSGTENPWAYILGRDNGTTYAKLSIAAFATFHTVSNSTFHANAYNYFKTNYVDKLNL